MVFPRQQKAQLIRSLLSRSGVVLIMLYHFSGVSSSGVFRDGREFGKIFFSVPMSFQTKNTDWFFGYNSLSGAMACVPPRWHKVASIAWEF